MFEEQIFVFYVIYLFCNALLFRYLIVYLQSRKYVRIMTTFALENLWTYLQGLSLKQAEREWLANKLIEAKDMEETKTSSPAAKKIRKKNRPLSPDVELLGNLHLREFTQKELDEDPLLAAIVEDRRQVK